MWANLFRFRDKWVINPTMRCRWMDVVDMREKWCLFWGFLPPHRVRPRKIDFVQWNSSTSTCGDADQFFFARFDKWCSALVWHAVADTNFRRVLSPNMYMHIAYHFSFVYRRPFAITDDDGDEDEKKNILTVDFNDELRPCLNGLNPCDRR